MWGIEKDNRELILPYAYDGGNVSLWVEPEKAISKGHLKKAVSAVPSFLAHPCASPFRSYGAEENLSELLQRCDSSIERKDSFLLQTITVLQ